MMFAKYFEYYTIMLRGGAFFLGHCSFYHMLAWYMPKSCVYLSVWHSVIQLATTDNTKIFSVLCANSF